MSFREELLDEMVSAAFANGAESVRTICAATLDAALAFRQTVACPECGGIGFDSVERDQGEGWETVEIPCPAGCVDGRVPLETRLAIVEPAEYVKVDRVTPDVLCAPPRTTMTRHAAELVYRLASSPEGTPEP